jgi:hypothetical protein
MAWQFNAQYDTNIGTMSLEFLRGLERAVLEGSFLIFQFKFLKIDNIEEAFIFVYVNQMAQEHSRKQCHLSMPRMGA